MSVGHGAAPDVVLADFLDPDGRHDARVAPERFEGILQGQGVQVPSQFLVMLPDIACIVVLVLISSNAAWIRANMPASLGKPFVPGG